MTAEAPVYAPPTVRLGDSVYWYNDPTTLSDPQLGWVAERPGSVTVTLLVFAPGVGFIEKPSVRHVSDPGLRENPAWRTWGCWDFSQSHKDMARAQEIAVGMAMKHERDARRNQQDGNK
jgi:hypothetical protein